MMNRIRSKQPGRGRVSMPAIGRSSTRVPGAVLGTLAVVVAALAGCATVTSLDDFPYPLAMKTREVLQVPASDIRFSGLQDSAPGSIRPRDLSYQVTIRDGRVFHCTSQMFPGLAGDEVIFKPPRCTQE